MAEQTVTERLEYLRGEIRAERISYGEIAELQDLAEHIDPSDDELLEWAGVPEHPKDIWELLEDAPQGCEAVSDLWHWSTNHDAGKGPATLFLDLIGWSQDEMGEAMYDLSDASLGYVELDKLARALTEYADRPHDVREYVDALLEAEAR